MPPWKTTKSAPLRCSGSACSARWSAHASSMAIGRPTSRRAARRHVMPPEGRIVQLSPRTIEAWYYRYKRGGFDALLPDAREDKGTSRAIRPEVAEVIVRAKREKPRCSV